MTDSAAVRETLIHALRLDLVGPSAGDREHAAEILPQSPSRYYLTGFLIPYGTVAEARADDTIAEELGEIAMESEDEKDTDRVSTRRGYFPSSIGLTVILPEDAAEVSATVDWADYEPLEDEPAEPSVGPGRWQRRPGRRTLSLAIAEARAIAVDGAGLELVTSMRSLPAALGFDRPVRVFSVYLVNRRASRRGADRDRAHVFQVGIALACAAGFIARPDPRGLVDDDPDVRTADLQYRDLGQYAVGHNISASAEEDGDGICRRVGTVWMPRVAVDRVDPAPIEGFDGDMRRMGEGDWPRLRAMLEPLVRGYAAWLADQAAKLPSLAPASRREHGAWLHDRAIDIQARIADGLALLADDTARTAFAIANRAVAAAWSRRNAVQRGVAPDRVPGRAAESAPTWRPFQIGFMLANLRGIFDPEHADRQTVDLLFFPTGGGKTEAYLGLAAFTLALRRLRRPGPEGGGVSVLMRYTLRLLTLEQLDRAASLICALERERLAGPDRERLGDRPFEIGLWVGQATTPNRMGASGNRDPYSAKTKVRDYKRKPEMYPSPLPIQACPWCGKPFNPDCFRLLPDEKDPTDLRLQCANRDCDFAPRNAPNGLPILAIDEALYRRLPCFLVATSDKFAGLPWLAEAGKLFGRVERFLGSDYFGPGEGRGGTRLPNGLPGPDLIIQDELHLIAGPLGTMAGLYETAIEGLTLKQGAAPKIVASTATVRHAKRQIQALFARERVAVFPPPGIDRHHNFFAVTDTGNPDRARLYLGIAAQGRSLKVVLMRAYLALLAAAHKAWLAQGGESNADNPVDPYMTLLGYFNALRELGGSRRIVEDEIRSRLKTYDQRKREGEIEGLFAKRDSHKEPAELTSRERTDRVARAKQQLADRFTVKDGVEVALATNMISVGLDIARLGLMVVLGQPKTTAEYIQATSRVGRDDRRPGLVVTLLNVHRPRDRSHYESFEYWHRCFYRSVEVNSVTPFSARSLDRGLAAVVVALARHLHEAMTPATAALKIAAHRQELAREIKTIFDRRVVHLSGDAAETEALKRAIGVRIDNLLQSWEEIAHEKSALEYRGDLKKGPPLLLPKDGKESDPLTPNQAKFAIPWSLREVEPKVNLWIVHDHAPHREDP